MTGNIHFYKSGPHYILFKREEMGSNVAGDESGPMKEIQTNAAH